MAACFRKCLGDKQPWILNSYFGGRKTLVFMENMKYTIHESYGLQLQNSDESFQLFVWNGWQAASLRYSVLFWFHDWLPWVEIWVGQ